MAVASSVIDSLSPEWLTQTLRKNGYLTASQVVAFSTQRIGDEVGFLDAIVRLILNYDRKEKHAPDSLVIKVSSTDATYQRIGDFYHAYEREFHFYETIAPNTPIRLPRCFGREVDPQTNAHLLLLEDLSALTAGDQVQGLTPTQARASVETIGQFHAIWWESTQLESLTWMPCRHMVPSRYQAAWPKFRDLFRGQLSASALALGDHLSLHVETLLEQIERRPRTIVHSDFRADNLLFDLPTDPQPVVILDWQLAIRSTGMLDVARLLCGSMDPLDRAACEMEIVERWHETLEVRGVRGYSLKQAIADYKTCAWISLYYPVTIHEAEEAAGKRGTALAHAQIERFFTAAAELNV